METFVTTSIVTHQFILYCLTVYYASVGGAPEAYGSRHVCVSVSFREIVVSHISAIDEN